ncbi:hypothetical protein [Chitinibacter sp. GC72]|uniref:hypothetical protein n=1 Tax=Chitinibacter sp. GC72 TaxID=1526917 RepID=UPI0012F7DF89|nr:hypothetical protein [Chitinibacter sp. GC72]
MRKILLLIALLAMASAQAGVVEQTTREAGRGFAKGINEGTAQAFEKMLDNNDKRMKQNAADAKRKQRLANISGCATNAKRTSCKCFDKQGSIETILDEKQCMEVVNRGLAAVNDF